MKKLLFALPFLLLSSCKGNTEMSKTQIYSCEGMVLKNSVETPCLSANGKFTFNMALGENVELDYSNCASSLFNWREFKRKENSDLRLSYEYKYKTNKGVYVTQELNVDKVSEVDDTALYLVIPFTYAPTTVAKIVQRTQGRKVYVSRCRASNRRTRGCKFSSAKCASHDFERGRERASSAMEVISREKDSPFRRPCLERSVEVFPRRHECAFPGHQVRYRI